MAISVNPPARLLAFALALDFVCGSLSAAEPEFQLDANYPGGNVQLVSQEGDIFTVAPDLRDIKKGQWWFYYNFRLRGPEEKTATIRFVDKSPVGVRGPAISTDGGRTWKWMGAEAMTNSTVGKSSAWSFQAAVPKGAAEARFAFAPTYLESNLRDWLAAQGSNPALKISELCRSRKGRGVELIRAGCLDDAKERGIVLLTARHHACESMASYALEGLLAEVLSGDEAGQWRERWQVIALPFADKDGVEDGDQGKNRAPHDHNRDYNEVPIYPEIAAWMKLGESLQSRVVFSLDMHCPSIRGVWNDRAYFVGAADPAMAEKERAFVQVLEAVRRGSIPFLAADCYLPFGKAWNQASNYADGRSSAGWARKTFPEARFAGTIEVAYADALGVEVNADSARALGRDLARAIWRHLGN